MNPLQHHKNTDNDNNNTYYKFWDVQGVGGRWSSHKYQSLWSFTQKIMEYQWVCCHLSSTLPLPHPPDYCSSVPAFSDREDVQNSEQEEPLPLLHHWNQLPICVSSLEDSGPVSSPSSLECSCRLICVIVSVTAFTSGPSSICGKKLFLIFLKI